ncbi:MAG TPA: CocE/NonD family hydrolase, partial [Gemmatimonadales bacterium]|nr:CocE/NonD family hydrolase [Gemmatimonadales bacterium]
MTGRRFTPLVFGLLLAVGGAVSPPPQRLLAQQAQIADRFTVTDTMIPMRDGVPLHTKILVPRDRSGPLPMVMKRTPYGIEGWQGNFTAYLKELADEGYLFVFQDIRGRYRSEGT